MLNKVMIMGRLGRDPEIKYLQSGAPMASFNVATDESWTDRNGQRMEHTEWHRVITFQRLAENCANHIGKGSLVYVEGSLQTRKWTDANGQNRYQTEIKAQRVIFLDKRRPEGQVDNQAGVAPSVPDWGGSQGFENYNEGQGSESGMQQGSAEEV